MALSNRCGLAVALVVASVAATGCDFIFGRKLNPKYCMAHLSDPDCRRAFPDAAPDGPTSCTGDEQCPPPLVCDLSATMMCVQCTMNEHDACMGTTPICLGRTCQKCTKHAQCLASNVCLPDGACADEAQVAYVQAGGAGSACTKLAPCGTLDAGLQTNKPIVKIASGTIADDKTTIIDGKVVMILADPGAKLTRTNTGVILDVRNTGADVQIFDLEISGGTGVAIPVVSMLGGGTPKLTLTRITIGTNLGVGVAAFGGSLTMSQSTVRGNMGGGILILEAQFDITNTYIVQNGSNASNLGGLAITTLSVEGTHRLDFNTISANNSDLTIAANGGINCAGTVPLAFDSNIIFGNNVSNGGTQIGGNAMCTATYSDIGPDMASGIGNINAAPMFVNSTQGDFHLMGTSPAKDAANPAATLADDADGDARPQGQQGDMGADEIKP